MNIGDVLTVSYEEKTSNLYIFAIDEEKNPAYTVYRLMNVGDQHLLSLPVINFLKMPARNFRF